MNVSWIITVELHEFNEAWHGLKLSQTTEGTPLCGRSNVATRIMKDKSLLEMNQA